MATLIYTCIVIKTNKRRKPPIKRVLTFDNNQVGLKQRRWTESALECYKHTTCKGCFYNEFFKGSDVKCQMRKAVIELVRTVGTPNISEKRQNFIED